MKEKVYQFLLSIPKGKIVTYKQIAEYLGNKNLSRVVGNILHNNPDGEKYPCYKVVNSKGCLSSAYAFGGEEKQKELLENDGLTIIKKGKTNVKFCVKDFKSHLYSPTL